MNCTWAEFFERISFRPHLMGMTISVRGDVAMFALEVRDIHTNEPIPVYQACHLGSLPPAEKVSEASALQLIRRQAMQLLAHELDECLLLDGAQFDDPHIAPNCPTPKHCGKVTEHRITSTSPRQSGRREVLKATCACGAEWRKP